MSAPIAHSDTPVVGDNTASANSPAPAREFHLFPRLPPEIRHQIYQEAMLQPCITFIGLAPCRFDLGFHVHKLEPKEWIWKSAWEQWVDIRWVNQEAADSVDLVTNQSEDCFLFNTYSVHPMSPDETLLGVHLCAGRAFEGGWEQFHRTSDADVTYNVVGAGVKRVGFWWQPEEHQCAGHTGCFSEFAHDRWKDHLQNYNRDLGIWFCSIRGPCFGMMRRYFSYFRDAKTIYFMCSILSKDIRSKFQKDTKRGVLQHIANEIVRAQRAKGLERWEDYAWTWYEADFEDAESLFAHKSLYPWHIARALRLFLKDLHPDVKSEMNPKMEFKVLVTGCYLKRARVAREI